MTALTTERAPSVSSDDPRLKDRSTARTYLALVVLLAVAAVLPFVLDEQTETVAVRTLIFAIMAVGWNLMSGYGGMFSFGHAAFFGIGAYTDAYLLVEHGISPWIAMVVGASISAAAGTLIAFLCLRYRLAGAYFALATFAFAQVFLLVVQNLDFLRRTEGFNVPLLTENSWWMLQFEQGSHFYYWIPLAILGAGLLGTVAYVNSRSGQYVQAVRDDEVAAASLGINVMRVRLVAVAISCAFTSLAGAFYTQYYFFVGPEQAFGSAVSVNAIVPAVIGGIGTVFGPVVGAMVVGPLSEWIATVLREPPPFLEFLQGVTGLDVAVYAALLILIVLFMPKGIYGTLRDRFRS
ncbi:MULTISPECIES: branched-chain amino acid ABC transporter permease [Nocardioides]|uniref:Branched-chain amino acid ABC transporter permease n=1 Tax=Nocardioides oceani TaxID=3058369 RepID=A0ABT8FFA0_9ACTN|nr:MULTISPECIES: branched-chain amino acid ABC transporter permease [Nocardioides]MDN4173353.1 branched-chain amino acid ABC transporter permease [Nocardioides oceani]WKN48305.1 branched-chain amino acid ABC transporter permease [Nocardioides sp. Arc9.136]